MEKVQAVIDFLLTHKLVFTALIVILISIIRRMVLSMIRGVVAFVSEAQRSWLSRTKHGPFNTNVLLRFILWQTKNT